MMNEKYQWLAATIAAHTGRTVASGPRLQMTVRLLQRCCRPEDRYTYTRFFHGLHSEGLTATIGLLKQLGFIQSESGDNGNEVLRASNTALQWAECSEFESFRRYIPELERASEEVLEYAATYDSFRELRHDHNDALECVRRKYGVRSSEDVVSPALNLLSRLGLYDNAESTDRAYVEGVGAIQGTEP